MARYLVVAHQTATSPSFVEAVREHARREPNAEFVLLVPATHVSHLLTWTEGESQAIARRDADTARDLLIAVGVYVTDAKVGDASPLQAIGDELRDDPAYDGLIISTLPASISRWLRMDVCTQAERRFGKPVIAVTAEPTPPIA